MLAGQAASAELSEGLGEGGQDGGVVWRRENDDRLVQAPVAERGHGVCDRSGVAAGAQPDVAGQRDLFRITADVLAVRVQHITLARELFWATADKVPVLREPRGGAQRAPFPAAADAHRRVRLLPRLWLTARAGELVVPAGEVRGLPRQQAHDDLTRFLEPVAALGWGAQLDAVGPGFLLVPSGADAQFEPAAGNDVEGRGHVGQDRWMTVVNAGDQRPQPEPLRRLRERGERHPSLQARARRVGQDRVEVVERPARLEDLDAVGLPPDGEHAGPGGVLRGSLEGEAHAVNPCK